MDPDRLIIRVSLLLSIFATCGIAGIAVYEKALRPGLCILSQCQPHYFGTSVVSTVISLASVDFLAAGIFLSIAIRHIITTRRPTASTLRTL